jgi:hypothetical protein
MVSRIGPHGALVVEGEERVTKSPAVEGGDDAKIQDQKLQSLPHLRTRARLPATIPDVPHLLPVPEFEGRDPGRDQVELVAAMNIEANPDGD